MSVDQSDVIDRVTTSPEGVVALVVFDHLPWHSFSSHHELLLTKLNAYLEFVEAGQIYTEYPSARDKPLELLVFFQFRPTPEALSFLERVRPQVERFNISFKYGPALGVGYADDAG
jgi:hypothetical protein